MDSYELSNRYLALTREFADLCGEQVNIERALNNGVPDCDKPQLELRLAGVRKQLEAVRRNLEQAS